MGEGIIKTVIAGKNSNVIGNSESPLILRGQGVKVQWGNKYIDLIKNGKINVDSEKILKIADSIESVTTDGIYLIEDLIWVVIDKVKTQLSGNSDTAYISFLVELPEITAEQKLLALTNIGFYYDTFEDAQAAGLTSGLIYVQGDNKLYIVKEGTLLEYIFTTNDTLSEDLLNKLYIEGHSLMVEGIEYATLNYNTILLHKELILKEGLLSEDATSFLGFRIYIKNGKSYLEIDKVIERDWKGNSLIETTYSELKELINKKELLPKLYYLITDFQNPWEVTWGDEPIFFEDLYTEINGSLHLSGVRNAMQLIVLAKTYTILELQAFSLTNPDWIIHYDIHYIGPEETGGFRKRTKDDGSIEYLPCKGRITYLKDELGNEGNFNFRQFLFKLNGNWRYIMDTGNNGKLGEFETGTDNIFNLESIDTYILVFLFNPVLNGDTVIGYEMISIDSDEPIEEGHNIRINKPIKRNVFNLPKIEEESVFHTIQSEIIGNTFDNIKNSISIEEESIVYNNIFKNLEKKITIKTYAIALDNVFEDIPGLLISGNSTCKNNILNTFLIEDVVNINCIEFNNNKLYNFFHNIENSIEKRSIFSNNIINNCENAIVNLGNFIGNSFEIINADIFNYGQFENNNIINSYALIENLEKGNFKNNVINNINDIIINNAIFGNNSISNINSEINNEGTFETNIINSIEEYLNIPETVIISNNTINTISGYIDFSSDISIIRNTINNISYDNRIDASLENNKINIIESTEIYGDLVNNTFNNIISCTFDVTTNNKVNNIIESIFKQGFNNNIADNIEYSIFDLNVSNNVFKNIIGCTFTGEVNNNSVYGDINNEGWYEIGTFTGNIINRNLFNIEASSINSSIFNYDVLGFIANNINYCTFSCINNLDLSGLNLYHSTFHGNIGGLLERELETYEIKWLADNSKKKDVYPNIKVICVPDIVPIGMIMMWSGNIDSIPDGWAICDGTDGRPNLVGSFIKGGTETREIVDYPEYFNSLDNTITLTSEQMPNYVPEHTHELDSGIYFTEPGGEYTSNTDRAGSSSDGITIKYAQTTSGSGTAASAESGINIPSVSDKIEHISFGINDHVHYFEIDSHTHEIDLSDMSVGKVQDIESRDPEPIKIEPKHWEVIFIIKIR